MGTYGYWVPGSLQVFQDVEASELGVEVILDEVIPAVLADVSRCARGVMKSSDGVNERNMID